MKYVEMLVIWILSILTNTDQEMINWDLGYYKSNNSNFNSDTADEDPPGSGYSLFNFAAGYLNWNCKIETGWTPPEFQTAYGKTQ